MAADRAGPVAHARAADGSPGGQLEAADLDNNGAVDSIVPRRDGAAVVLGDGAGRFEPLPGSPIGADVRAVADLDGDGRLELIALAGGQPVVAERQGDTRLPLAGRAAEGGDRDRRSAHQLVRHRRTDRSADRPAPAEAVIDGPIVHVGLGTATARRGRSASSGRTASLQSEFDRPAGTTIAASQRLKGSCPWLFAWNGREMALRDRPDLAIAARPAHQRAGHRRRPDDRGLGQGPRRSARRRATAPTTCASPRSCGRRTSSISCR